MVSIVTLTGYSKIFEQFRQSADQFAVNVRKIVVTSRGMMVKPRRGWEGVEGVEPFVFARNANLGIAAAERDDVLLINDDVQLRSYGAAEKLEEVARAYPRVGILSSQILGQSGGNPFQDRRTELDANVVISRQRLAFVCVYLKRALLNDVGPLDERFTGYGCEDDDYCLRAQNAGWELAVTPEVVVRHGYGATNATASFGQCPHCAGTGRDPALDTSMEEMRGVFYQKWGRRP